MRVCGVVCEYNPFHLGHALHLWRTRELLGEDTAILCVMSGNFVQRGEASILEKHSRAEAAVRCGADLVVELPLPWAVSSAERFALGGTAVLARTGVADAISFGSECGDLTRLACVAEAALSPKAPELLREELKNGASYASAREAALRRLCGEDAAVLGSPNDLLAVEYLKALRTLGADLEPIAVKREGAPHDGAAEGKNASASFIRERLLRGEDVSRYLPRASAAVLERERSQGRAPVTLRDAESAVLACLRTMDEEAFERLPDGSEGLWRRFMEAARREPTLDAVLTAAKTKRYAYARLRRMALAAFLGLEASDASGLPPYIHVLAFNGRGRALLARIRRTAGVPVVTKPASVRKLPRDAQRIFGLEARAGDLYALLFRREALRRGGGEWLTGPVIVKDGEC